MALPSTDGSALKRFLALLIFPSISGPNASSTLSRISAEILARHGKEAGAA
jgi:hypothetical protein